MVGFRVQAVLVGACALLLQSCSSITILRTRELRAVQAHIDSLVTQVNISTTQVLKLTQEQHEMLRLIRADMQNSFEESNRSIASLNGTISESSHKLTLIDQKTQTIQDQWSEKARLDSVGVVSKNQQVQSAFDVANSDFSAGRFDLAANGFKAFLTQFPDAPLCADAQYWLAECFYAKKDFDKAETEYKTYLKKYPTGQKQCTGLYKLGLLYDKQQKQKSTELVFKKLLETCPDSDEAKMVRSRTDH